MKQLSEILNRGKRDDIKIVKKGPKHNYNWQFQAEEVSNWFGKPLYWLFHKFSDLWIMSEFEYFREKGNRNPNEFIRNLNARKKRVI